MTAIGGALNGTNDTSISHSLYVDGNTTISGGTVLASGGELGSGKIYSFGSGYGITLTFQAGFASASFQGKTGALNMITGYGEESPYSPISGPYTVPPADIATVSVNYSYAIFSLQNAPLSNHRHPIIIVLCHRR